MSQECYCYKETASVEFKLNSAVLSDSAGSGCVQSVHHVLYRSGRSAASESEENNPATPAGLHDDDDDDVHALAKQSNYGKFVGVISVLIESQPGRR